MVGADPGRGENHGDPEVCPYHQERDPVAGPGLCYISGTGEIQGQFMCHGWIKTNLVAALAKQSCVPVEELTKYAGGKGLYGWIVQKPERFDKPIPLEMIGVDKPPVSWRYLERGGNGDE